MDSPGRKSWTSPPGRVSRTPADAGAGGVRDDGHGGVQGQGQPGREQDRATGESEAPSTATAVTGEPSTWSRTAASWIRQFVSRVQARSVSPAL